MEVTPKLGIRVSSKQMAEVARCVTKNTNTLHNAYYKLQIIIHNFFFYLFGILKLFGLEFNFFYKMNLLKYSIQFVKAKVATYICN